MRLREMCLSFNLSLHINPFLHFDAEVTSSVAKSFLGLSSSISLQWFILVSTFFLQSKAAACFQRFPSLQAPCSFHSDAELTSSVTMCFLIRLLQSHFNALSWVHRSPSLQCFIMVSALSFTPMLYFTSMPDFSFMLPFTSTPRSHRVWPCFL